MLNKGEKIKMLTAIALLNLPDKKTAITAETSQSIKDIQITDEEFNNIINSYIKDKYIEKMATDEELLKSLAEQALNYAKDYPPLMLELKNKYFNNL